MYQGHTARLATEIPAAGVAGETARRRDTGSPEALRRVVTEMPFGPLKAFPRARTLSK